MKDAYKQMRITLRARRIVVFLTVLLAVGLFMPARERAFAAELPPIQDIAITFTDGVGDIQTASAIQIMFLFVIIALVPTALLMMTSFTRIIIVLHFMRSALGTQQMPPNQILIGIALVLSLFIMSGPLDRMYNEAFLPFTANEISVEEFGNSLVEPLRDYMFRHVGLQELQIFGRIAGMEIDLNTPMDDISTVILTPAFVLTELRLGFIIGFWIYVPFIVIDMVVASVLMAMGMMMLPPAMISLPFKIMVFVMSDGWQRLIGELVAGFVRVI